LLRIRQKAFVEGEASEKLMDSYERNGIITGKENKELQSVVKKMYCIEPRLFQGLNKEQQRMNIGLINVLLKAGKKNEIIQLIQQVVQLTEEDRELILTLI
jgi:hypothetical protein